MRRSGAIVALLAVTADAALLHFWSGALKPLYGIRLAVGIAALGILIGSGTPRERVGLCFHPCRTDFRWIGICSITIVGLYGIYLALVSVFPTTLGIDFSDTEGAWNYLWTALLLAPLAEEILYRGVVVPALQESFPAWMVIVASGILFYLLHLSYGKDWRLLHYIPAGMILTWAFLATKQLWVPILLHFLGNVLMGVDDLTRLLSK